MQLLFLVADLCFTVSAAASGPLPKLHFLSRAFTDWWPEGFPGEEKPLVIVKCSGYKAVCQQALSSLQGQVLCDQGQELQCLVAITPWLSQCSYDKKVFSCHVAVRPNPQLESEASNKKSAPYLPYAIKAQQFFGWTKDLCKQMLAVV